MQARYLLFMVALLSASLFIGSGLLAQQKTDSASNIDTTSITASIDSSVADRTQSVTDSILVLQKKKVN